MSDLKITSDSLGLLLGLIGKVAELCVVADIPREDALGDGKNPGRLDASWTKSLKDYGDAAQIPKELGDVQIATLWLAQLTGIRAGEYLNGRENQTTVSEWCDLHYPGFDRAARVLDVIEETTELAAALRVDWEGVYTAFDTGWRKASNLPKPALQQKIQELEQATSLLARNLGVDLVDVLDLVMQQNRARKTIDSMRRFTDKQSFFGHGDS